MNLFLTPGFASFLLALGSAIFYALMGKFKTPEESFNWSKFLTSIAVGAIIGIFAWGCNIPVTPEFVMSQIAAYAGGVALVEFGIKGVLRRWFPQLKV